MKTMNATVTEAAELVAANRVKVGTNGGFEGWCEVYVDGIRIRSEAWCQAILIAVDASGRPVADFAR